MSQNLGGTGRQQQIRYPQPFRLFESCKIKTWRGILWQHRARLDRDIAGELLKRDAKFDMTYMPYPGSPPAMNATLAGTITPVIANYSDLKGQIDADNNNPHAIFLSAADSVP